MAPTILFDLDGTLVDTPPELTASMNRTLEAAGHQPFATGEVGEMIGNGMPALPTRALARRKQPFATALLTRFHADYRATIALASRPYPATIETIAPLANSGWLLAVASNKFEAPAHQLLQALDIAKFFAAIGSGDSFPVRKPDPGHRLRTRAAGVAPLLAF